MRVHSLLALFLPAIVFAAPPALTIYNQNFAVVRDTVPLDLKAGTNTVRFTDTTAHVEPASVILRDPAGKVPVTILEQNYRNDPVSQERLLALFEGKTIDFEIARVNQPPEIKPGKIVRSGYAMHAQSAMQRYGQQYAATQMMYGGGAYGGALQPMIEMDGKIRFGLPGIPIFPALADGTILKPELSWQLATDRAAKLDAELAYVTGGMSWEADYNVTAAEQSDTLEILGWVTMDNQSGRDFENARIKLMAGDVSKLQPGDGSMNASRGSAFRSGSPAEQAVTEKAFEDYHLYTLARPATLLDRETKQVEFVRAAGVQAQRVYVYDGAKLDPQRWRGSSRSSIRQDAEYGTESNPKVWIMRELKNSEANHLGLALPKGQLRFYKKDADGQLEFTGENIIDHTPKDETMRIYTGNAFDLVGERRRTSWKLDSSHNWADEEFEIKVRNHKQEAAEIRVVEHLYRWVNWEITEKSNTFLKTDAQTVEFRIQLKPDEEQTVTYKVHYSW